MSVLHQTVSRECICTKRFQIWHDPIIVRNRELLGFHPRLLLPYYRPNCKTAISKTIVANTNELRDKVETQCTIRERFIAS